MSFCDPCSLVAHGKDQRSFRQSRFHHGRALVVTRLEVQLSHANFHRFEPLIRLQRHGRAVSAQQLNLDPLNIRNRAQAEPGAALQLVSHL